MNPRKRIPATLTAILAILALTACGETPKGDAQGHDDALALAIRIEQTITATPLTPDEIERLAINLWEHNGERPIVYESGKRIADRELEWWKQVAVSAWGFINGTEKEQ